VKADTLSKLQQAARDGAYCLIYFDRSGFSASPPVHRGWSLIGQPHRVFPQPHCKRSVLGAFDLGAKPAQSRNEQGNHQTPRCRSVS
jgi:hypothetical protein